MTHLLLLIQKLLPTLLESRQLFLQLRAFRLFLQFEALNLFIQDADNLVPTALVFRSRRVVLQRREFLDALQVRLGE